MPLYDYACADGHRFEARHGFNDPSPACPICGQTEVKRVITRVPSVMQGMSASLGENVTRDQLREKWAEETPRLRRKLASKLGEDAVNSVPTLNAKYE